MLVVVLILKMVCPHIHTHWKNKILKHRTGKEVNYETAKEKVRYKQGHALQNLDFFN